jgi:hypothetical protein
VMPICWAACRDSMERGEPVSNMARTACPSTCT